MHIYPFHINRPPIDISNNKEIDLVINKTSHLIERLKIMHTVLIGGNGYVGEAYQEVLEKRGISYKILSRSEIDYYNPSILKECLKSENPDFVINTAGYAGKPNVDACELDKANCMLGNAVLPGKIAEVCEDLKMRWGHVSSGCIYNGYKDDKSGYTEKDIPNFSFRTNNCSFYSGTKAMGEEVLERAENCYIWRLRIPFDNRNSKRNYLYKLMTYDRLLDTENSVSERFEFVDATIECFIKDIPFGTYNVTNPGYISAREITEIMREHGLITKDLKFFANLEDFMGAGTHTPRSNCIMSCEKLSKAGIELTEIRESLTRAITTWQA